MITAIVFIQAAVDRIPEVAEQIAQLPGVSEVYSVTGEIDLIALVRVRQQVGRPPRRVERTELRPVPVTARHRCSVTRAAVLP